MPIRAPAGNELPFPPPEKPRGKVLHGGLYANVSEPVMFQMLQPGWVFAFALNVTVYWPALAGAATANAAVITTMAVITQLRTDALISVFRLKRCRVFTAAGERISRPMSRAPRR